MITALVLLVEAKESSALQLLAAEFDFADIRDDLIDLKIDKRVIPAKLLLHETFVKEKEIHDLPKLLLLQILVHRSQLGLVVLISNSGLSDLF
jgi:hypothetical protein